MNLNPCVPKNMFEISRNVLQNLWLFLQFFRMSLVSQRARSARLRQRAATVVMDDMAARGQLTPSLATRIVRWHNPLKAGSYGRVFADAASYGVGDELSIMHDSLDSMEESALSVRTGHPLFQHTCIPVHHGPGTERRVKVSTDSEYAVLQRHKNYFELVHRGDPVLRQMGHMSKEVPCAYDLVEPDLFSADGVLAPMIAAPPGAACGIVGAVVVMVRDVSFNSKMPGLIDTHAIEISI